MPYGIDQTDWDLAKAQIRDILGQRAPKKDPIRYGELVRLIEAVDFAANDQRLFHILGEVSTDEARAGRGMLSALVVSAGDNMPGSGFFELAKKLGRKGDDLTVWMNELNKLAGVWALQGPADGERPGKAS